MNKLDTALTRMAGKRVYIDTNIFIFFTQKNQDYFAVVAPFIQACFNHTIFATTGLLAIAEVMVYPYRTNDPVLIAQFKTFFSKKDFLTIVGHENECYDTAALLAGKQGMKLLDAIHYVTALQNNCQFIITNDRGFQSSETVEVIQLEDLLETPLASQ